MNSWWVKAVFVVLAVFAILKFAPAFPVSSAVTQKTDLFTANGEGKVSVVPDTGKVDLGISTNKSTVKDAQNETNTIIKNMTDALKKLGIADKDIQTSNYSIYPQIDYQNGNKVSGYQVSANVEITVRDISKLSEAIDVATANGANNVSGVQFTVADDKLKDLQQQARDLAVKDAKVKATSLAAAAGVNLGRVVNVVETSGIPDPRPMMATGFAKIADASAPTQINPGSTDIVSDVTLSYETR